MSNFYQRINQGIKIVYINRDKIIILAAGSSLIYYSIASIRQLLLLLDQAKGKYIETCTNIQFISDYIRGQKRCEKCDACFKYQKSFEKHLRQHKYKDEFDEVFCS